MISHVPGHVGVRHWTFVGKWAPWHSKRVQTSLLAAIKNLQLMASVNDVEDRGGWVDKFTEETDNTGAVELTAPAFASTGDPPVSSNDVEPDVTQTKNRLKRVDSKDIRIKKYDSVGTRRQKMKNLEKFLGSLVWRKMVGWRGFFNKWY